MRFFFFSIMLAAVASAAPVAINKRAPGFGKSNAIELASDFTEATGPSAGGDAKHFGFGAKEAVEHTEPVTNRRGFGAVDAIGNTEDIVTRRGFGSKDAIDHTEGMSKRFGFGAAQAVDHTEDAEHRRA